MSDADLVGQESAQAPSRPWLRPLLLMAVVVILSVVGSIEGFGKHFGALKGWLLGLGPLGPITYAGIYALAVVAALPGFALTIFAGVLFGSAIGIVVSSLGSTVGATLAFLIARHVARRSVEEWVGGNETLRRLDARIQSHGGVVVAVTRLVPLIPFNVLNYALGLTSVSLRVYVLFSWVCMLPATLVLSLSGDVLTRSLAEHHVPWRLVALLAGALVCFVVVGWRARRHLHHLEAAHARTQDGSGDGETRTTDEGPKA